VKACQNFMRHILMLELNRDVLKKVLKSVMNVHNPDL
jgi:hypothetical protein